MARCSRPDIVLVSGPPFSPYVVGAFVWAVGLPVLGHYAAADPGLRYASYAVAGVFVAASAVLGVAAWVRRRRAPAR